MKTTEDNRCTDSVVGGTLNRSPVIAVLSLLLMVATSTMSAQDAPKTTAPLQAAATAGRLKEVKALLAKGANVDALDEQGRTALMDAAAAGKVDVVNALLAAGARLDVPDRNKNRAIMYAARNDRAAVLFALLKAGADPNNGHPDAYVNVLSFAVDTGNTQLVEALLKAGANPHCYGLPDAGPIILHAAKYGDMDMVRALMAAGADIKSMSPPEANALMFAAEGGKVANVLALLQMGFDPNQTDTFGKTALDYAANDAVAQVLRAAGGKPGTPNADDGK